jgi:hypothetical protein
MNDDDQAVKVYEGEPTDIVFLKSLLDSAGIEVVTAGAFFGPGRELYVRRRDEADTREILADFESHRRAPGGSVLPGRWET